MTPTELRDLVFARLPAADDRGEQFVELRPDGVVVRLPHDDAHFGNETMADGSRAVSGGVLMALADTSMYAACLVVAGPDTMAVAASMTSSFLRAPQPRDLLAVATVRRRGRRLAYLDCEITNADEYDDPPGATVARADGLIAHVVGTWALRSR
ncbi:MAG: PaaI family thioesterase [Acidimicrobiia bacterium]|nr:PaaI family thioesterase [Acidimicrobiia bacterium]